MQDDIKAQFGSRVRELREKKNISQEKLAAITGLHRTYIGSVERGERNISLENIRKIAIAFKKQSPNFWKESNELIAISQCTTIEMEEYYRKVNRGTSA